MCASECVRACVDRCANGCETASLSPPPQVLAPTNTQTHTFPPQPPPPRQHACAHAHPEKTIRSAVLVRLTFASAARNTILDLFLPRSSGLLAGWTLRLFLHLRLANRLSPAPRLPAATFCANAIMSKTVFFQRLHYRRRRAVSLFFFLSPFLPDIS